MHPAANPYQSHSVSTATPGQLVQMLYERALVAIARAGHAQQEGGPAAIEVINRELQRAQDILIELQLALDHARGGDIARNLDVLYSFCLDQLVDANLHKDVTGLEAVVRTIEGLREAWQEACALAAASVA